MLTRILGHIWSYMPSIPSTKRSSTRAVTREAARHVEVDVDALRRELSTTKAEAERWRVAFAETERALETLKGEYTELAEGRKHVEAALTNTKEGFEKLKQREQETRTTSDSLRKALDAAQAQSKIAVDASQESQKRYEEAQKQVGTCTQKARETTRDLKRLQIEHKQLEELLDTRTAELRDAQVYLSTSDSVSDADLKKMVATLNELIYQFSASLSSKVTSWRSPSRGDLTQRAYERLQVLLGRPMADQLLSAPAEETAFWAQLGLQAVLSFMTSWTITTWDVRMDPSHNNLLRGIHGALLENEPQAVSARWRTLTQRYVKSVQLQEDRDPAALIEGYVLNDLENVLILCGTNQEFLKREWSDLQMEVRGVVRQTFDLKKAIGEDVFSADYTSICPTSQTFFASDSMADADDCGRGKKRKASEGNLVLCTTGIGLRKVQRVEGGESSNGQLVAQTLLQAKVMLFN